MLLRVVPEEGQDVLPARRLSPGGCADLLAITLFLDSLETHA
jgi:triphosphoribosyl-dephospho-CoA synthetase